MDEAPYPVIGVICPPLINDIGFVLNVMLLKLGKIQLLNCWANISLCIKLKNNIGKKHLK